MKPNRTKDKGDKGLAYVIADLVSRGYYIFLPISEHLPFDVVVANETGVLSRLQVKYRKANVRGAIDLRLISVYSNAKGTHYKPLDLGAIDAIAIYCPDSKQVYYIPSAAMEKDGRCMPHLKMWIRMQHSNRTYGKSAKDFLEPNIFGALAEAGIAPDC